jgi:hypothetical protein
MDRFDMNRSDSGFNAVTPDHKEHFDSTLTKIRSLRLDKLRKNHLDLKHRTSSTNIRLNLRRSASSDASDNDASDNDASDNEIQGMENNNICRFCLENINLSRDNRSSVLAPCACTGSSAFVHKTCFKDSLKYYYGKQCTVCLFDYYPYDKEDFVPVNGSDIPEDNIPFNFNDFMQPNTNLANGSNNGSDDGSNNGSDNGSDNGSNNGSDDIPNPPTTPIYQYIGVIRNAAKSMYPEVVQNINVHRMMDIWIDFCGGASHSIIQILSLVCSLSAEFNNTSVSNYISGVLILIGVCIGLSISTVIFIWSYIISNMKKFYKSISFGILIGWGSLQCVRYVFYVSD